MDKKSLKIPKGQSENWQYLVHKTQAEDKQNKLKKNISLLCGNRSGHHNTEIKA